jgi:hypothetical protein
MPTIRSIPGPYRLYFYSFDCNERAHVHAQRDAASCKFWLSPLTLAANYGVSSSDLKSIKRIIFQYRPRIVEAWREHCGATR